MVLTVVDMFEFLELPDWDGTSVSQGEALDPNRQAPKRTTDPLSPDKVIPEKDYLMDKAEKPDDDVLKAREKKEKANADRAAKRAAGEGPSQVSRKRQKKNTAGEQRLAGVDAEKKVLEDQAAAQSARIAELEGLLATRDGEKQKLEKENKDLVAQLGQSEVVRHNTVRSLIPTVFKRLVDSVEYKKSLAKPYSLTYSAGWLAGVRIQRKQEDVDRIISSTKKINLDAPKLWKAEYNNLFSAEYPYIQKIADAYRLAPADLMNIFPDGPSPQGLVGSSSRPAEAPANVDTPQQEAPADP
ncbi:hypothetical protein CTI12_AA101580 [Artemisia annua]|uniref:Uncharacterized protein n=1 Tax=Artemisia annua TaxID=35608 RepID=A0A2U1PX81_ARTAN|nr:hypothetical protein CTI12_AA101580 [Artemisia annua]